jgi:O-methyltransferase
MAESLLRGGSGPTACESDGVMNERRRQFAAELHAASHAHDQGRLNRLERFRNVESATAELLGVLVRASGARLVSVDIDAARTDLARENPRNVLLDDRVELRTEDAKLTLGQSNDSEWDFVFLDAERPAYPSYVRDLVRTLAPGGVLAVDNVRSHEHELLEFTLLI